MVSEGGDAPKETHAERQQQQSLNKIRRINEHIRQSGQLWVAGETSISRLSYQEKLRMFGAAFPISRALNTMWGVYLSCPGQKTMTST
jgi:hypothetical protein